MTVIRRDCHCGSVCIRETVVAFQDDGRQVSPFKTDIMCGKIGDSVMVLIWHLNDEMVKFCSQFSVQQLGSAQYGNPSHFSIGVPNVMSKQRHFFCPSQWHISSD